ncbi:MAG TPA: HlyD family efflux transporter periplasmic adaptor subunit [Steroidobacteraceae bacterium]|nr:HlyD family efflux transporter periplasmic adaptor subunit [Steroidobacteraceae bacterium]
MNTIHSSCDYRRCGHLLMATLMLMLCACASRNTSTFNGYVEGDYVYIASSQAGQLVNLSVVRGQRVAADAPLFEIDPQNETAAVAQAKRQYEAALAQQHDLLTGKRPPEIAVIRAQIVQARADATNLQLQLQRDEQQYAAHTIAKSQLDDARAAATAASAHVDELESDLKVAQLPGRDAQIKALTAQAQAAQAALEQAQWRLDQTRIRAPSAGLIFDTLYRNGEWVPAGSPVINLLPPGNVKIRFYVPEMTVGSLKPGRHVTIHCDGCAADVAATISFISDRAEYTPPVIYSNETRNTLSFLVEARPAVADAPKLHPGQPVTVTLQ